MRAHTQCKLCPSTTLGMLDTFTRPQSGWFGVYCNARELRGGLWGWQVGGMVELPELRLAKKVKSMQVFRKPVLTCRQGDRAGICVTQLNAASLERTLLCAPGSVPTFTAAIAAVEKVRFFSGALPSKSKVCSPQRLDDLTSTGEDCLTRGFYDRQPSP